MDEKRGKLIVKKETEIITETFKRREFVIETIEQYPQKIPFQLTQDKTGIIDSFQVGQEINVSFNFRGTESKKEGQETKYYLNLQAWRITL